MPSRVAGGQTGSLDGQITSAGVSRHYILHMPTGYQESVPMRLVLNFHGYGFNSKQEEALSGTSALESQYSIDTNWGSAQGI
jgi:poly(3-hydroxybutyrate) depolymerase